MPSSHFAATSRDCGCGLHLTWEVIADTKLIDLAIFVFFRTGHATAMTES